MRLFQSSIALAAVCIVTASAAGEIVRWQTDTDAAMRLAAQSNRLVLIHFVSRGCEPCARLEATVFSQPTFAQALETDFVPVKVNATDFPITAQRFGVTSAPTDVVITPAGQLVCKTGCPPDAAQYVAQLRRISDTYRRVSTEMATANQPAANQPAANQSGTIAATRPPQMTSTAPANDPRQPATTAINAGTVIPAQPAMTPGASAWGQPERSAGSTPTGPTAQAQPPISSAHIVNPTWSPDRPQTGATAAQPLAAQGAVAQPAPGQSTVGTSLASAQPAVSSQPSVALDGYCPVQLIEGQRWTAGDRRFGAVHRGRLYFFSGPTEQQRFMRDPDQYSPMLAGYDAVLWQESGQLISGRREHGVFHDNRVYLFATEESLARFERNPSAFIAPVEQAMRSTGVRR